MNFLQDYYDNSGGKVLINAEQGSGFAKNVASDFNPIHDPDSRRFCVPGDLLFAVALDKYGLHQKMHFQFLDMVGANISLAYPDMSDSGDVVVKNNREKDVVKIKCSGLVSHDAKPIEQLLRQYVSFSGMNFPHILVPLMQQHNVMINPKRPLVIYESMSLNFDDITFSTVDIELTNTSLEVDGRKGNVQLHFDINSNQSVIGTGCKTLILSGLREYEEQTVKEMCELYESYKI